MGDGEGGRAAEDLFRYRGIEYRRAAEAPLDPLLHPEPWRPPRLYLFVVALACWLVRVFFRLRVEGLDNVPPPPFIIASNHQAWYDTLFILAAFARLGRSPAPGAATSDRTAGPGARRASPMPMVYTMARRDTVFNRGWKRRLLPRLGVFPITPRLGELDEQGVRCVYQVLARGGAVLIFPEGRYSIGRQLRPLKKGVGHFALQAGVPICPVAIAGLERLRPFKEVHVSIGRPIWPDAPRWWSFNRRVLRVVESVRRAILRAFDRGQRDRKPGRLRRFFSRLPFPWRRDRPME
jgi:1-acyl-sn-glycerol-3-phosphate acyltransferase